MQKGVSPFLYESINSKLVDKYKDAGWETDREFQTKIRMKRLKPFDMAFEDEVWTTIANLGFYHLNKDRNFEIPYSGEFFTNRSS